MTKSRATRGLDADGNQIYAEESDSHASASPEAVKQVADAIASVERAKMLEQIHQEQMLADKYTQEKAAEQRQQERKRLFQAIAVGMVSSETGYDDRVCGRLMEKILFDSEQYSKERA